MRNEPASFPPGGLPTTEGGCREEDSEHDAMSYTMPGYTTYDAAIGVAKDNWTAQVTGNNFTN